MKITYFTVVTSILQILLVLRVVFRVHVYWSGSDTYPVFRTRFTPSRNVTRHICVMFYEFLALTMCASRRQHNHKTGRMILILRISVLINIRNVI